MQRYFVNEDYKEQDIYYLKGEMFHHIAHVMRMKPKDTVYLAFQNHLAIVAEITEITEDTILLKERAKENLEKELPVQITIASGYPKGDKLEWIVQKGTELGAHRFLGFPAQSSVVKWDGKKLSKKKQRLAKIAQEAAEQAHRQVVPEVQLCETATDFFEQLDAYDLILVAYEESAKKGESAQLVQALQQAKPGSQIVAIFGPEGGLTPKEIDRLTQLNAKVCGLGPRILRTETAPLYFLSAVSYQFELLTISE
ncbi:MAG: 16S rRNA (uracil(1498)-N(3))-methyltransferase [Enterococcus sp.]